MQDLCIPGKITGKTLKAMLSTPPYVQGVFASYWGYIKTADQNGQVIFPRKQHKPIIYVLVTSRINPVMMIGRTIHHWEIDPQVYNLLYKFERIENKETKKIYWQVTQTNLPENNIIGLDTITIFAEPKHIIIPLGKFKTKKSPHWYLPDIYVRKNINHLFQSLWILNVKNFFSVIDYNRKQQSPTYTSLQVVS